MGNVLKVATDVVNPINIKRNCSSSQIEVQKGKLDEYENKYGGFISSL